MTEGSLVLFSSCFYFLLDSLQVNPSHICISSGVTAYGFWNPIAFYEQFSCKVYTSNLTLVIIHDVTHQKFVRSLLRCLGHHFGPLLRVITKPRCSRACFVIACLPVILKFWWMPCIGSVLDLFFFATCNPKDGCLIPAPYFPAFDNDMAVRVGSSLYLTELLPSTIYRGSSSLGNCGMGHKSLKISFLSSTNLLGLVALIGLIWGWSFVALLLC